MSPLGNVRRAACVALAGAVLFACYGFSFKDLLKRGKKEAAAPAAPAQEAEPRREGTDARLKRLEKEYAELKQQYAQLEADRENILAQTKHLLTVKTQLADVEEAHERAKKAVASVESRNARLHRLNRKLRHELSNALGYFHQLELAYQELYPKHEKLIEENAQLSLALIEKIDRSPEYQKLKGEAEGLSSRLKEQEIRLNLQGRELGNRDNQLKALGDQKGKLEKIAAGQREQILALTAERDELLKIKKELEKALADAPRRFQEMANENKTLLKETADMHYNMGVFFTENRNYPRALKEFRRALDFNPNDPKVHYNLGYLYAEQFKEHGKAMAHFKRYLEIDPQSKDAEAIRSYLLVRQTMGDKMIKN
jgi:tetratricopeptide (TPR) repeat protein